MSDNPQFKRTDKAIIQALISLLKCKPFEKITVQDILDETPVTRATFYAHYRDKYEIAEKMLAQVLETRETIRNEHSTSHPTIEMLTQARKTDREVSLALMNIQTENVNLRKALTDEMEREYLEDASGPTAALEARVYAQAYTELYLSLLTDPFPNYTIDDTYQLFISICLRFLNLTGDPEVRVFLEDKVKKQRQTAGGLG